MKKSIVVAAAFAALLACQYSVAAKIDRVLVGAALVGDGAEVAQVDLIIGPRGTAAENTFCNALVNNKDGFITQLVIAAIPSARVKLPAALYNKVSVQNSKQAAQISGPAYRAVEHAVADSVEDGTIPVTEASDLYISVGVFIDRHAQDDAKIEDFNYRATRQAIQRAVAGQ